MANTRKRDCPLPNGLELSQILRTVQGVVPCSLREAARRKQADFLLFSRMPAGKPSVNGIAARQVSRRPFVPDVLTGILVISQGFSEFLGGDRFSRSDAMPFAPTAPRHKSRVVILPP